MEEMGPSLFILFDTRDPKARPTTRKENECLSLLNMGTEVLTASHGLSGESGAGKELGRKRVNSSAATPYAETLKAPIEELR